MKFPKEDRVSRALSFPQALRFDLYSYRLEETRGEPKFQQQCENTRRDQKASQEVEYLQDEYGHIVAF